MNVVCTGDGRFIEVQGTAKDSHSRANKWTNCWSSGAGIGNWCGRKDKRSNKRGINRRAAFSRLIDNRARSGHLRESMKVRLTTGELMVRFLSAALLRWRQERNYSPWRDFAGADLYSAKVDYVISLPSPLWHLVGEPDEIHQHTEFIYGDRNDGFLRVRKETLPDGTTIKEFARQDLDPKERFLPGYIGGGKEEAFAGRLSGDTISFEHTLVNQTHDRTHITICKPTATRSIPCASPACAISSPAYAIKPT
jgi:hypothetical protein